MPPPMLLVGDLLSNVLRKAEGEVACECETLGELEELSVRLAQGLEVGEREAVAQRELWRESLGVVECVAELVGEAERDWVPEMEGVREVKGDREARVEVAVEVAVAVSSRCCTISSCGELEASTTYTLPSVSAAMAEEYPLRMLTAKQRSQGAPIIGVLPPPAMRVTGAPPPRPILRITVTPPSTPLASITYKALALAL